MILMPNNNSHAHLLSVAFPGQWGQLMSPAGKRDPRNLPWALDNGMFSAWKPLEYKKDLPLEAFLEHWDGRLFLQFLDWAQQYHQPRFVVVPDVPGNSTATIHRFKVWRPAVEQRGFQPAIAVQDGMAPDDVPPGVVCFVGGSTEWKWKNMELFAAECDRVHVGRVNRERRLWQCYRAGVESIDGSGFFMGDQRQLAGIMRFCRRVSCGLSEHDQQQLQLL